MIILPDGLLLTFSIVLVAWLKRFVSIPKLSTTATLALIWDPTKAWSNFRTGPLRLFRAIQFLPSLDFSQLILIDAMPSSSDNEFDIALSVTPSLGSPIIVTSPWTGSSKLSIVSEGLVYKTSLVP